MRRGAANEGIQPAAMAIAAFTGGPAADRQTVIAINTSPDAFRLRREYAGPADLQIQQARCVQGDIADRLCCDPKAWPSGEQDIVGIYQLFFRARAGMLLEGLAQNKHPHQIFEIPTAGYEFVCEVI